MSDQNQNAAAETEQAQQRKIQLPEGFGSVSMEEVVFHFKKDKELGTKRDSVKLRLPFLTVDGVVEILESGDTKQVELLLNAANEEIVKQARQQVNDKEDISEDTVDYSALSWQAIANLPPAARRGGGISQETWAEFGKDYAMVMAEAGGRNEEQINKHLSILLSKMQKAKTNKPVLNAFKGFLALYVEHTNQLEEFQECVDFLNNKIETFLNLSEAELLANL